MISRAMKINGRRTSVRLEPSFWAALDDMARRRGLNVVDLVAEIDRTRGTAPLTRALRVVALSYFREALHRLTEPTDAFLGGAAHGMGDRGA